MGKAIKKVGSAIGGALGIGGGNTPRFDPSRFSYNMDAKAFGETNKDVEGQYGNIQNRAAQNVEGIDQRESRARQTSLAQALEAQSRGEGPSVAQNQLKQATDRNLANQMALAASTRGPNLAATQRQVMQNTAAANQAAAAESANLRLTEQQAAQQQLGALSTQMREQDAAAQANSIAQQSQMLAEIAAIRDANRSAAMNLETTRANQALGIGNQALQDTMNRRDNRTGVINGLMGAISGAAGGAATASDEKLKKDVGDGSADIQKFLDALEAKKFKYKEPDKFGEGERVGVMAQDVESGGPLGKAIVSDTEEGKMLDISKGFGAVLAAQSELNKRLKKLESRKKA